MPKNKSYLTFNRYQVKGRKTICVEVKNTLMDDRLGVIEWDTAWRKYVFVTIGEEYKFDAACQREIADYLDKLMWMRKKQNEI